MTAPNDSPAPPEESPGRSAALRARNAVEEVLLSLKDLPLAFDREQARDRLLRAIQCAYAVMDSSVLASVHLDGLTEAASILAETCSILRGAGEAARSPLLGSLLDRLTSARAALLAAADEVSQIQLARRDELIGGGAAAETPAPRPFRASLGVPQLHAFLRRPLAPDVIVDPAEPLPASPGPPAPPAPPPPKTLEELRAFGKSAGDLGARLMKEEPEAAPVESAPEPLLAYEPAIEEVEVLRRLARDCLDDIANGRPLRAPNAIESWPDVEPFEQALLDNIDAFVALGGAALPTVSLFFAEAKAPDPERAFAVALTLGCVEGSDTIGAAVMTLKQSDPETFPGWIEGFSLAPSPAVDAAMADLCTSPRDDLVALALDVLHARGSTPEQAIIGLLDRKEPAIRRRVARALATVLPHNEAVEELSAIGAASDDDDVFLAVLEALLRRGHDGALLAARGAVAAPSSRARADGALALLCLAGRSSDLDLLLSELNRSPSPRLLRGLGRFGHAEALYPLLNGLHAPDDPEIVAAAAEALERITGAGLREVVEEPWEVELPPEAEGAGGVPIPTHKVERVIVDPAAWEAWLKKSARDLPTDVKLRAGVPFSPLFIVDELESRGAPPERRIDASLELALVTGITPLFSPTDWVARQRQRLTDLRAQVASLDTTPGAWTFGVAARATQEREQAAPRERRRPSAASTSLWTDTPPPETHPWRPIAPLPPPLPFAPLDPRPPMISAEAAAAIEAIPDDFAGETTLPIPSADQARAAAKSPLPFKPPTPPPPPPLRRPTPSYGLPFHPPPFEPPPGLPSTSEAASALGTRVPILTVEQYAMLCVEVEQGPPRAMEIRARYGLSDELLWSTLRHSWDEQLRRDPELRQQWSGLCAQYARTRR